MQTLTRWRVATNSQAWLAALFIVLSCYISFRPIFKNGFINFDDDLHIFANPLCSMPLKEGLTRAWSAPYQGLYVPFTYTIWILASHATVKPNGKTETLTPAWPFHLISLVFHTLTALLLFLIVRKVFRSLSMAVIASLFFALHPIQVEAVAWASSLKDLLSTFWCLLSVFLAIPLILNTPTKEMGRDEQCIRFLTAFVAFTFGLLSKPSVALAPFAIIPLLTVSRLPAKKLAWALSPFLLVSISICFLTSKIQSAIDLGYPILWWQRVFVALDALTFYIAKILVPIGFIPDYGRTPTYLFQNPSFWPGLVAPLILGFLLFRKTKVGFLCFLSTVIVVLPVLGFLNFFFQFYSTVADRFIYIGMIFPAVGAAYLCSQVRGLRWVILSFIAFLGFQSFKQVRQWQGPISIFTHTLRFNPRSFLALNNLAAEVEAFGKRKEAFEFYRRAVEVNPNASPAYFNMGRLLAQEGKLQEAKKYFYRSLELYPFNPSAQFSLGLIFKEEKQLARSIEHLKMAAALNPFSRKVVDILAEVYRLNGNPSAANEIVSRFSAQPKSHFDYPNLPPTIAFP